MDIFSLSEFSEISRIFIPVIACVGVYIAYQQHNINREKIKYDLFDKRFKIYESINEFLLSLIYEDKELKPEDRKNFRQACNESEFLFSNEVYKDILKINDTVLEYDLIKRKLSRENIDQEKRDSLHEDEDKTSHEIEKYQKELSKMFKPFIQITKV